MGPLKGNHGEVTEAVSYWLEDQIGDAAADHVEVHKQHGRIEERSYWWVGDPEFTTYLADAYGWPDVLVCGRVVRKRRPLQAPEWTEVETHVLIYGSRQPTLPTPEQLSRWVREHWDIENRVFWVLDVTYGEDRNHARKIALPLSKLRCLALNVIRHRGYRYIPDGHRAANARPDRGLA